MSLLLTIIQSPASTEIKESTRTFTEQGGSIGRGADNQWVLEDPERYLSSRHCQISHQDGQFRLMDTSTNGTFLNGSPEPLGKGNSTSLKDGDRFTLGDYEFQVTIWAAAQPAAGDSPFLSSNQPASADDDLFGGAASDSPFGADSGGHVSSSDPLFSATPEETDPLRALDKASSQSDPFYESDPFASPLDNGSVKVSDPFSSSVSQADGASPVNQSINWPDPVAETGGIPEDWDEEPASDMPPVAQPVAPIEPPKSEPSIDAQQHQAEVDGLNARVQELDQANQVLAAQIDQLQQQLAAKNKPSAAPSGGAVDDSLIQALGLAERGLEAPQMTEINQLVGELMREMISGLMQILSSRSSIKNEFRMSVTTIQPVENNPLKFSVNVDDALENMFIKKGNAYKKPREAIQEGFGEIAEHQIAVLAGIRAAFKGLIERFDPLVLEKRFDKQNKGGLIPGSRNAKNWELFCDYYSEVAGDLDNSFQYLFGDDFVRAYEDQLQRLAIARNTQKREQ